MAGRKTNRKSDKPERQQSTASPKAENRRMMRLLALVIAIFGFLLYINTIGHDYVLDDFSVLKENFVTKRGIAGIPTHFQTHSRYGYWPGPGELYRPVPMSMFSIEWQLAPDQPWLSHLVNILLYALTGALLFLTLVKLLQGYNQLLPFLTTLFFMAHPVHVEVVANIKSRDEIVMFLLSILSINLFWRHLKNGDVKWLILALVSYLAALFSKENAVTFVAIVPLVMWFFSNAKVGKMAQVTAMYAALAVVFILVRKSVVGAFGNPGDVYALDNILAGAKDSATRLATAFLLLGKYLWNLLFPYSLGSDYGFNQIPLTNWSDWRVLLSFIAWIGIGAIAFIRLIKKDLWSFAILFFLINFSIFTNVFFTIGTSFGDRLLYSASPGFALVLTLALMKFFKVDMQEKVSRPAALFQYKTLWAVAGVILALFSLKTVTRNMDWKTSYSLYEADIEKSPNSAKLNFHYGLEIVQTGLELKNPEEQKRYYERAKAHFEKAISILPSYHDAYSQLGLCYYREGNKQKALENYELAIKYKNNFPLVYSNMGIIYFEQGNLARAKEVYEKAVHFDPRMVDALRNLGAVHAMEKNFGEAIKWFAQALQYAPEDPTINFYLGSAYKDSGQVGKGRPYLEKAYRLDPSLKK